MRVLRWGRREDRGGPPSSGRHLLANWIREGKGRNCGGLGQNKDDWRGVVTLLTCVGVCVCVWVVCADVGSIDMKSVGLCIRLVNKANAIFRVMQRKYNQCVHIPVLTRIYTGAAFMRPACVGEMGRQGDENHTYYAHFLSTLTGGLRAVSR
jgi:hypothetical protein